MITLYQSEWCFYSHRVRQVLTELGLTYTTVNVPAAREDRVELMAIAGQDTAPVLTDGDKIYGDSDEIIDVPARDVSRTRGRGRARRDREPGARR